NTAEFYADPGVHGTFTGSGATFVNLSGTIDSGAYWYFAGTDTIASTASLSVYGTLAVTGEVDVAGNLNNGGTINVSTNEGLRLSAGTGVLYNQLGGIVELTSAGATGFRNPVVTGLSDGAATIINYGIIASLYSGDAVYFADTG